jgi:tyrosyl-tRNA synthetase
MPQNAYDVLKERGFIEQCTHEDELRDLLSKEKVTFYCGFDPTADSLTAGHFLQLMAMAHLTQAGHRAITLMGTGTGMVGDPTDKQEMRRLMTKEEVDYNISRFKEQISNFVNYDEGGAIMVENGDWLLKLPYVDFIRNIGVHFSVNRMLAAETYKVRLEDGLTFFEMNYMLMQAYDFLHLYRQYGCRVQCGGNDQWSNIIAGVELIRKVEKTDAFGLAFTLLVGADGRKMGKSLGNAVWLDPKKTSPYELFQYWRNTDDSLVIRNLKLLTFLPMEEINEMAKWQGADLNRAKEIFAYEVTKIMHGKEEADKALAASKALFTTGGGDSSSMPSTEITKDELGEGLNIIRLREKAGIIESRSDGRRVIKDGGLKLNGEKVTDYDLSVTAADFRGGSLVLQKGKKVFHRVDVTDDAR